MKTKEEISKMSNGELQKLIKELEEDIEDMKGSSPIVINLWKNKLQIAQNELKSKLKEISSEEEIKNEN